MITGELLGHGLASASVPRALTCGLKGTVFTILDVLHGGEKMVALARLHASQRVSARVGRDHAFRVEGEVSSGAWMVLYGPNEDRAVK